MKRIKRIKPNVQKKGPGRTVFSILHTISLYNRQYPEMQEFSQYLPFFKSNHIPIPDGGV